MKPLPQLKKKKLNKCFHKINKNVGVNRAPVRTRPLGRAGDLGHDTFEKENLIKCKIKELNGHPRGFGSDSPFGSGRTRHSFVFKPKGFWMLYLKGSFIYKTMCLL